MSREHDRPYIHNISKECGWRCLICGALVTDCGLHTAWHAELKREPK